MSRTFGLKLPSKYLNRDEHVLRFVKRAQLRVDEDDEVFGVLGAAFRLKEKDGQIEEYLSTTWREYFMGKPSETTICAIQAFLSSGYGAKKDSYFCILRVGAVADFMLKHRIKLRFIHEPDAGNSAHVAIRGWPVGDPGIFDIMVDDVECQMYSKSSYDGAKKPACVVSERGTVPV